ncbi:hypothetical protein CTheo_2893 [Ceratobasidium theobromae]|uniref:Tyrosinase copper-binding domain-containing protein n=1 Tax=Ceratobasidium theobromae TaxID=1582974 RepID=A0A5N5QPL6_9AGAM|nr:hypothetical protein CTheo_2893 [Ceratobasidium theobromae]
MYLSVKLHSAAFLALAAVLVGAAPTEKRATCTNPVTYVEWRSLPQVQRNSFHNAVKCLRTKTGGNGFNAFDRYPSVHDNVFSDVHYVANFLPWHRQFLYLRRLDLQDCGYTGPTPYWDWTIDAGRLSISNIWSPLTGFGGNGNPFTSARCVQNGPYANFQLNYPSRHCLARRFNNGNLRSGLIGTMQGSLYSTTAVRNVMRQSDFINFASDLEEGPHDIVHSVIAGDMTAAFSPNDALSSKFFLHHQQIDRIWALWQGRNATRLQDYAGNTVQGQDPKDGSQFPLANLTDALPMQGIRDLPDVTVADVMDTMSDKLCYVAGFGFVDVLYALSHYHSLYHHSFPLMRFLTVLLPFAAAVLAVPTKRQQCTNPAVRVEWRSLTADQRTSFHNAVKCMQSKPSNVDRQSLFDRYSSLHVDIFANIHYVAAFLPFHRYFSYARDISLKECGYNGPSVYWDWTIDASNMANSPIFSPTVGFGGTGTATRSGRKTLYCITDGPYGTKSNFKIAYPETRCLQRQFSMGTRSKWGSTSGPSSKHSSSVISGIMQNDEFTEFWPALEEGPHDSVHNEISGDMAAAFSPDDPLFFEHHNNVDRIWALWQGRNATRLQDYNGNTVQNQDMNDGTLYPLAKLDDKISLGGLQGMPDVTVRDLMDTQGGVLCYKYDK